MKKIIALSLATLFTVCVHAQRDVTTFFQHILDLNQPMSKVYDHAQRDVTTFLGIPVDGTYQEMKHLLVQKGFVAIPNSGNEFFKGEFNGNAVGIYILTNKDRVCAIGVVETTDREEDAIKPRYNTLVGQFENNKRYITPKTDQRIPEEEDISDEMTLNHKLYEAWFYQKPNLELADNQSADGAEKCVGLYIMRSSGFEYHIVILYINRYNMAGGEDL